MRPATALKLHRLRRGYTVRELAAAAGLPAHYVIALESAPTLYERLGEVLGVRATRIAFNPYGGRSADDDGDDAADTTKEPPVPAE